MERGEGEREKGRERRREMSLGIFYFGDGARMMGGLLRKVGCSSIIVCGVRRTEGVCLYLRKASVGEGRW
jgi:hypothetical protein